MDRPTKQNTFVRGSVLSAGVLLALALFLMVNYLAARHYKRIDTTSGKLYTLSQKSINVVENLDRDIEMVMFLNPGAPMFSAADELLSRYAAANPTRIEKRIVDPARNMLEARTLVERHGIERDNVIVVATEDDRRVIDEIELAEYDYSQTQFGQPPSLKGFKGEQLITSAILELVEAKKPRILFTTGHGEATLEGGSVRSLSQAGDLLGKDNFELESWAAIGESEVPEGTDLVVVAGPTSNFLEPEFDMFARFLERGGRLLVLLDPALDEAGSFLDLGWKDWLRGYGVELRSDVVIDPAQQLPFYGPETLYTDSYGIHPIVESLEQTRTPVLFPLARSVSPRVDAPEGFEITELLRSGEEAWGETGLENLDQDLAPDGEDLLGPVPLGVAVSFSVDTSTNASRAIAEDAEDAEDAEEDRFLEEVDEAQADEARLVVLGDVDFATDAQIANVANGTLLLNTFNWLVQREQLIAIEPRRPEETKLSLSQSELVSIYFIVLGLLPALSIVFGVWMFYQRRR